MIQELPFFELLLFTLLPFTIAMLLFIKLFTFMLNLYRRFSKKIKSSITLLEIGDFLLFLVFFVVIIQIVLYITGDVPDDFSIFNYLIEDMLPITWYTILLFGIMINLYSFMTWGKNNG